MPDTNDLPTDSAVSQLTSDLCRELYDRFAMGGWMPQDAHAQTEAMIRQRFDTPAADAGPRQCPAKLNGNPPPCCRLKEGHSGDHESLQPHGILSWPPVPQEAAPLGGGSDDDSSTWQPATAPDWAMRVARQIVNFQNTDHTGDDARICFCAECEDARAALIRQAGSEWERELATVIVNLIAAAHPAIQSGRNGWVQSTPNVKKLEIACAEASRLLGGESNG